jgi:hypothetical protein
VWQENFDGYFSCQKEKIMKEYSEFADHLSIDDLLTEDDKVAKKVKGKSKGNRTELILCKLLSSHFGVDFTRSIGSGNRWSQVNLSEMAKQVYTGDICVPEGFLWVVESKGGYEDDMNLNNVCDGNGIAILDEFIEQVSKDAEYCGRKPIICWKRNRKPWLAVVREEDLLFARFEYRITYRDWVIVKLDNLLDGPRSYWFNED